MNKALDPHYIVGYLSQAGKSKGCAADECKTLAEGLDQFLSEMTYWLDSAHKKPKGEPNDTQTLRIDRKDRPGFFNRSNQSI